MSTVQKGTYVKTSLDKSKRIDQLESGKTIRAADEEINKKCELQLNNKNFQDLKAALKEHLEKNLKTKGDIEDINLAESRKAIASSLVQVRAELEASEKSLQEFSRLKEQLSDENIKQIVSNIDRTNQDSLVAVMNTINQKIKLSRERLDKLQGSSLTKNVFSNTQRQVDLMKKSREKTSKYIEDIDLTKKADGSELKIEGKLFTGAWRVGGRNLKGVNSRVIGVNARTKVYKVTYEGRTLNVSQNEVCLVSDEKLNESS